MLFVISSAIFGYYTTHDYPCLDNRKMNNIT